MMFTSKLDWVNYMNSRIERLEKVCQLIIKDLYLQCNTPANYDEINKTEFYWLNYEISQKKEQEIIDNFCRQYKINGREKRQVRLTNGRPKYEGE